MTTATLTRLDLPAQVQQELHDVPLSSGATLALRDSQGRELALSPRAQQVVLKALTCLAQNGEVSIGRVPDQLTSTVAADMLGVSRPTLLRWAREGKVASTKVGTHTRFRRDDVIAFRDARERERRQAFDALRALDAEDGYETYLD